MLLVSIINNAFWPCDITTDYIHDNNKYHRIFQNILQNPLLVFEQYKGLYKSKMNEQVLLKKKTINIRVIILVQLNRNLIIHIPI